MKDEWLEWGFHEYMSILGEKRPPALETDISTEKKNKVPAKAKSPAEVGDI